MTRASYTVDFKLSVVEWVRNGERSLREASKTFGVDRKCIRQWVRESAALGSARVRQGPLTRKLHGGRGPLSEELDQLVLGYLLESRRRGAAAADPDLRRRAMEAARALGIGEFKASPSWLRGWKARSGVGEPRQQVAEDLENKSPVGSALVSHVSLSDSVLLTQQECSGEDRELLLPDGHVISHVITPDHTYYRKPPSNLVTSAHISLKPLNSHSHSYVGMLHLPMGGHLLESTDQLLLSDPSPPYGSMCVPSSDPVMSSTHMDHLSDLDIGVPLDQEIVLTSSEEAASLPPTPSLSSLSPPKRSSVDSRSLLWPFLGCTRTSPVTFPEFHDFTDPLTGLLGNRRSQPVFPSRPEILMSNSEIS